MKSSLSVAACATFTLLAAAAPAALPPLPTTPRVDVTDVMHGDRITDPYRWLEGSAAPELKTPDAALDARVRAWTLAQNRRTRAYLDAQPGREALSARLHELFSTESLGVPVVRAGREFFTRRRANESYGALLVRDSAGGEPRELFNIDTLYPDGRTAWAETAVSLEGGRVAVGLFKSGDENTTLRILDVNTGKWLPDTLEGKAREVNWLPGGDAFVYRKLADVKNPYSAEIRYHRLGDDPRTDRLIFAQDKMGPLATTYGPGATLDRTGRRLVLSYSTGTTTSDVWVCDFTRWLATGELVRTPISVGESCDNDARVCDGMLYLHTTSGAPNGRVFKIDLARPARAHWREIVAESKTAPITGISLAKDYLAVTRNVDALRRIELYDAAGRLVRELAPPGVGVCSLSTDETTNVGHLAYSAFGTPPTTYRVELASDVRTVYAKPAYRVDPENYAVKQLFFPSKDGVRVPLFVVHRKGLRPDGSNPTILYGYGGFAAGQKPGFSPSLIPWLDAGGVYAVAGLRGGDEYGEPWHRAGMLANKQRVFDDFIGAAEFLIAQGYTSPAHLGIRGGSNGGLLTGAALVQRPGLFSAVSIGVPLLDMLRYPQFLMGRYWVPEYGDPARPADYAWLKAYSPYHHITPGTAYPATLIDAGEKDVRVHPLHARKMAARLQAATSGDPEARPVLLAVDMDSGHGSGKSLPMKVRDAADVVLFFAANLGLKLPAERPADAVAAR